MISEIRNLIAECINDFAKNNGIDFNVVASDIKLEQIRHNIPGDIYTNASIAYAKRLNIGVVDLSKIMGLAIQKNRYVSDVYVSESGFINITINADAWRKNIQNILSLGNMYGSCNLFQGKTANVEFVSANPTGPLHTGHARNAVLGSCIANLMEKVGYKVTREFYINDMGNQIKLLGKSLYLRYLEACNHDIGSRFSDCMYHGEYIKKWASCLVEKYGQSLPIDNQDSEDEAERFCAQYALSASLDEFKSDLQLLGVMMDIYTSEKEVMSGDKQDEAFKILKNKGLIYEGILPKPKSSDASEEWEEAQQTLFRSTSYGDDTDRAVKKSNGDWTYFASDIAYHYDKISRGYDRLVNIFGADHIGYVKRIKAAVAAMCFDEKPVSIDIIAYQLVNFLENNVQIKMSKRSGVFITLKDVVEKVGKDITRFTMISRDSNSVIDFDFAKVVETSLENPLFYIQYCHARICSVFRNYEQQYGKLHFDDACTKNCFSYITHKDEIEIIKILAFYPDLVLSAAIHLEPHRICNYLRDLSKAFHYLWNQGKINAELRFIDTSNKEKTLDRMYFLKAIQIVIQNALSILGIDPVFEMK